MASPNAGSQDPYTQCSKFTSVLAVKVAQIVVQSRQGIKITPEYNAKLKAANPGQQWFNLILPNEPEVNEDTKRVLNGEVVDALTKMLCIAISLHTTDGDNMVLEIWSVKLVPGTEPLSPSNVYNRMTLLLKSVLSISRITPAYKLSRAQHTENYKISHKIYGGPPDYDILGENRKTIKVCELKSPIGTIVIEVVYRTKMAISPASKPKPIQEPAPSTISEIMMKSNHFPADSPKKNQYERKEVDLSKPLTTGAFVDSAKMKELHETLRENLPPEPAMAWMLAETEKVANSKDLTTSDQENANLPSCSSAPNNSSAHAISKSIEVPKNKKYTGLMEFAFADGSPITELANFYQECLHARSVSDEWTEITHDSASKDSDSLSRQLKMFEDAVPEFDSMVASMFSNTSDTGSDPKTSKP